MTAKITLYGEKFWYSPYVFTTFVALREKGLDFSTHMVDLNAGEHLTAEYRKQSITARVPTIEHEGFFLSESTAIVEYLDEAFPSPEWPASLPNGLRERARARQLMAWIRSDVMALREERSTETMFFDHATKPLGTAAQAAADKLFFVADALLPEGVTSLFGAFSVADADLAFMLHRLILNGDPVPAKLRRFAEAQWARPSIRAFVERDRPKP